MPSLTCRITVRQETSGGMIAKYYSPTYESISMCIPPTWRWCPCFPPYKSLNRCYRIQDLPQVHSPYPGEPGTRQKSSLGIFDRDGADGPSRHATDRQHSALHPSYYQPLRYGTRTKQHELKRGPISPDNAADANLYVEPPCSPRSSSRLEVVPGHLWGIRENGDCRLCGKRKPPDETEWHKPWI